MLYDSVGNRTSATDANGATTNYEYDGDNQLTRIKSPDGKADASSAMMQPGSEPP